MKLKSTHGHIILVDKEDAKALKGRSIYPYYDGLGRVGHFQVSVLEKERGLFSSYKFTDARCTIPLHVYVARNSECPEGKDRINHINEDVRDNRKSNLEWSTARRNGIVSKRTPSVSYVKQSKSWHIQVSILPENISKVKNLIEKKVRRGGIVTSIRYRCHVPSKRKALEILKLILPAAQFFEREPIS